MKNKTELTPLTTMASFLAKHPNVSLIIPVVDAELSKSLELKVADLEGSERLLKELYDETTAENAQLRLKVKLLELKVKR